MSTITASKTVEAQVKDLEDKTIKDIETLLNSDMANHLKLEAIRNRTIKYGGAKHRLLSFN